MFAQWNLVRKKKRTFHLVKRSARKPFTAFSKYRSPEKGQEEGEDHLLFLFPISSSSKVTEMGLVKEKVGSPVS